MSPYSSVKCPRNQNDFKSYLQPSCVAKLVNPQSRFRLKKGSKHFWKSFWALGISTLFFGCFYNVLKWILWYVSCWEECCKVILLQKFQKCFVDYETSPDFPSAWGEEMMTEFSFFLDSWLVYKEHTEFFGEIALNNPSHWLKNENGDTKVIHVSR